jgi:hypothetical protein
MPNVLVLYNGTVMQQVGLILLSMHQNTMRCIGINLYDGAVIVTPDL